MVHADAAHLPEGITTKPQLYEHIYGQIHALVEGQRNWISNLSNASSVIYHALNSFDAFKDRKPVNWAGFYLLSPIMDSRGASSTPPTPVKGPTLLLGPFHGLPACQLIRSQPGKGVCADASSLLPPRTVVVPRTEEYPGHIACDSSSLSEIVVPLVLPRSWLPPTYDASRPEWAGREASKGTTGQAQAQADVGGKSEGEGEDGIIIGVLDLDCTAEEGFDDEDRQGLERVARLLVEACDW